MTDVTVYGAGVFGLSIAWACLERGAKVRVIDPSGVGAGASGGVVGALAPHVPETWNDKKQFQLDSLLMAETWWAGVARASGRDPGYGRTGRIQPLMSAEAATLARTREATAEALWTGAARWRVRSVSAGEGDWLPPGVVEVVEDTLTARILPAAACEALAHAIIARGGDVRREGAPYGRVVWATGWTGLAALSLALDRKVGGGVKGQALTLALPAAERPQVFTEGVHIVPHADGTVAVGSTSEQEFDVPDRVDGALAELHARAVGLCPALEGAPVVRCWAGVRPRARSRSPMLGPWPGRADHFIANGGFKIGFGIAPKVAEVMADLVLEGREEGIPSGFRVEANL
ncbi:MULTISPECIES: NAD(P)/FAD-dependent oxidoreductase [unclassified Haematobacter]|uniref:NAD(P)/FAD-dependent oxidoreductase n=1 Tax=unclassified Haematobacter TaxID=2640585 RepID=UPI0025C46110|nr:MULTISPECIES: FAD-dependent oxidoreductase [unclassified Haematobacter]